MAVDKKTKKEAVATTLGGVTENTPAEYTILPEKVTPPLDTSEWPLLLKKLAMPRPRIRRARAKKLSKNHELHMLSKACWHSPNQLFRSIGLPPPAHQYTKAVISSFLPSLEASP